MPPIQAIFFDIDDTLYDTSKFAERARRAAVDAMLAMGLRGEAEALFRELTEVIHEFSANYERHFDKLLLRLPPAATAGLNPALVIAAGVVAYHERKFQELAPFEGVLELMQALARTDLVRGVITHGTTIKQAEKIIRLGIYPYLTPQAIFISDQIGVSKPNVKIYQRAIDRFRVPAANAVYVGNNPRADIDPPNALGMVTVRHRWGGKYGALEGETAPDHEISAFAELAGILRDELGVPI